MVIQEYVQYAIITSLSIFQTRQVVTHKFEKVINDGGEVMAKACTMTVLVSVFIIVMWIVLDKADVSWFAREDAQHH